MNSPLHSEIPLVPVELEAGLAAWQCSRSGGYWISLESYLAWQAQQEHRLAPLPPDYQPVLADDSARQALICPESGCLLQRFRVGHGLDFQIERSPVTGGIWLDRGEWEALKSCDLQEEIHRIFTAPYQKKIREEQMEEVVVETLRGKIGEADFSKVTQFKEWLEAHAHSRDILCHLLDQEQDKVPVRPEMSGKTE